MERKRIIASFAPVLLLVVLGCGGRTARDTMPAVEQPAVEVGAVVKLSSGQAFHFADRFSGGEGASGLERDSSIRLGGADEPVVPAPAPSVVRQRFRLPEGGTLRTAFGLSPESQGKKGDGVRFVVRLRRGGRVETLFVSEVRGWEGEDSPNWRPVSVDIPPSEGEGVEIELATEAIGAGGDAPAEELLGSYALWVNPRIVAPAPDGQPNIVVVIIDALRADHLGCYGYARETSPFLDGLAARGTVFEHAQSQATGTLPSMRSMLTSSHRFINGYRVGEAGEEASETDSLVLLGAAMPVSLQGELRARGYETMGCVGGGFLRPEFGFAAGFDWYWYADDVGVLPQQLSVMKERLSAGVGGPFFLLFHTYAVHDYFQGWGHCLERFDRGYLGRLTDRGELSRESIHGDPRDLSAADLQYIRDMYDGEIVYTDRYLEIFLGWLLDQPWGENTWIAVTADHGEAFGEHGVMSHGRAPYEEVSRVPLLVIAPRGKGGARRVETPVGLVDLAPTLLEVAGVDRPEEMVGRSVVPALAGGELDARPILSESTKGYLMARQGEWWYLTGGDDEREELYNTALDPLQARNLVDSRPGEVTRMRRALAELAMGAARGYRLVLSGPRREAVVVEIESDEPLGYFAVPTLWERGAIEIEQRAAGEGEKGTPSSPERVRVSLPAGDVPHVVLFEGQSAESGVTVTARVGEVEVPVNRFHLGGKAVSPPSLPVGLGAAARTLLMTPETPAPADPEDWGIWVWLTPGAARPRAEQPMGAEHLTEGVVQQLKSLGYLR